MTYRIITGDCLAEMPKLLADGVQVDSVVTDPPYHLTSIVKRFGKEGSAPAKSDGATGVYGRASRGFMGQTWDGGDVAMNPETWARACDLLKPGGHLIALCGTRTEHRVVCAIEDAGFEIRDRLLWLYGCLSEDTEILVDGRWEQCHTAIEGRRALCYDAQHDEFSWQPIEQRFVYEYDDTAFRVCSDNTDQLVSRNHRCLVERGGALVFELAEEAARQRQARVPILEDLHGLLEALPLPHEGAGVAQSGVRQGVPYQAPAGPARQEANRRTAICEAHVLDLLEGVPSADCVVGTSERADVLGGMQWRASRTGMGHARAQGPRGVDCRERRELHHQDDWPEQSGLEGRGDVFPQGRELQGHQVRPVSAEVPADGPEGWLRDGASADRREGNRTLSAQGRGGSPRRSRPAVERPAEPDAVREQSRPQAVRASRFTRTDLARIEPIHHVGRVWCVKVPTGAFVARRNGKVFVTGNSGFPKSHDVSKAIDRRGGKGHLAAEIAAAIKTARESRGWTTGQADRHFCGGTTNWTWYEGRKGLCRPPTPTDFQRIAKEWPELAPLSELVAEAEREVVGKGESGHTAIWSKEGSMGEYDITAPATEAARQWQGWGSALKPAVEIAVLARKPLSESSVAANVLKHGTGALNVDACRVASQSPITTHSRGRNTAFPKRPGERSVEESGRTKRQDLIEPDQRSARWPPNVLHDGSPEVLEAFARFGERTSGSGVNRVGEGGQFGTEIYGGSNGRDAESPRVLGDTGTAARFFPALGVSEDELRFMYHGKADAAERAGTTHPTVKPVSLVEWLCRLITPPGGTILDPFLGSGTTIIACERLGFDAIGIEQDAKTVAEAEERIRRLRARRMLGDVKRHDPLPGQQELGL